MVSEKYERKYIYDAGDMRYGFQLSNDNFDMEGDAGLPGFKPQGVSPEEVDRLFQIMELDFALYDEQISTHCYIADGLRKIFAGEKSDWKITYILVQPGCLSLFLRNKKLIQLEDSIRNLEFCDSIPFSDIFEYTWKDEQLSYYVRVDFNLSEEQDHIYVRFSHKRKDIKGEIDHYRISVRPKYASIKEEHLLNPAKRETTLHFSDEVDKYNQKIMIGEIEEMR